MRQFYFEKLEVWQDTRKFVKDIYFLCEKLPEDEKYGMISQIKRAATSVSLNIAEGMTRRTEKDKARFINQAFGSAIEVINLLVIFSDLQFISESQYMDLREKMEGITNQLNSLYQKFDV